jgi:hypothetical protein
MDNLICCNQMQEQILYKCTVHSNVFDCPDNLLFYNEIFNEYGLIIHDGGTSYKAIDFCPWCGKKLPKSQRDMWFNELEKLGFDSPFDQEIPEQYKTKAWRI